MAKTSVRGNQVTIDELVYKLTPAGAGQYAVDDEFGGRLGYITVRGRAVSAEDYGVAGAHPVLQIGKLWAAVNLAAPEQKGAEIATRGLCRVATHEKPSDADAEKARAHRAWLKKLPGCKASYYVFDPTSGKALSISIWENRELLNAMKETSPPDGAVPLRTTSIEVYPIVEEP
jgi:hypothetical protein